MNIFALLSLIAALLALALGLTVYSRSNRGWLSYIFLLFAVSLALLNFSQFQMRIASNIQEATIWSKLFGSWAIVIAFSVHFTFELSRKKSKSALFYFLLYLPGIIIFYLQIGTDLIVLAPVEKYWGWSNAYNYGIYHNLAASYGIIYWLLSLGLVIYALNISEGIKRKQTKLILIGFLINFIITLITDFFAPIYKLSIPELGSAADIITLSFIGYAIWKYQLFELENDSLSRKLFSSISNYLLLVDGNKKILEINQKLLEKLNYAHSDVVGRKMDFLLDSDIRNINPLSKHITQSSEFKNKEIRFKTKEGLLVSLTFSASFIKQVGQSKSGLIYMGLEDNQNSSSQQLIDENKKQIEFLAEAALDLVNLKTKEGVYNYIAEKVYNLLDKKAVIGCTELIGSAENNQWQVKSLFGFDKKLQTLSSILGFDIRNLSASTNEGFIGQLTEGKLNRLDFNLGDLTDGLISNSIGEKAKALFGLKELYVIPNRFGNQFFGALHIATTKNTPPINNELIETFMSIVSTVLNRQYAEIELAKSERLFKTIVEDSEIIIYIIDLEGKFLLSEGKPLEKLGLKSGEVVGQSVYDIYKESPTVLKQVERGLSGETFNELLRVKQDLYFNIRYTPYRNEQDKIIGAIGMADDISHRIESENKLAELNQMQTKLFSVIGHDLKSPMANIISFSDLILSDFNSFGSKEILRFVHNIQHSANNSYSILNSLLDWSKSVNSESCVGVEIVCLRSASDDSILQVIPLANKKDIEISNNIKEHVPVLADKNMVLTVIRNLLTNAIKFTEMGGRITISASIIENKVELSISDNGIGMTKEQVKNVFKFEEEKTSRGTEGESGSGIGLQICKEFMGKVGGRISAESQLKEGSVFTLTFPIPDEKDRKEIMISPN